MKEEDKLREINSLSEQTSSGDGSSAESCMLESEYERLEKEGKIKNRVYVCGLGWMLPSVSVYGCGCGCGCGEEGCGCGEEGCGCGCGDDDFCSICYGLKDHCNCGCGCGEEEDEKNGNGDDDINDNSNPSGSSGSSGTNGNNQSSNTQKDFLETLETDSLYEILAKNVETFNKYTSKSKYILDSLYKENKIVLSENNGCAYNYNEKKLYLDSWCNIETLTHEVLHYLQDSIGLLDDPLSSSNNEYQAELGAIIIKIARSNNLSSTYIYNQIIDDNGTNSIFGINLEDFTSMFNIIADGTTRKDGYLSMKQSVIEHIKNLTTETRMNHFIDYYKRKYPDPNKYKSHKMDSNPNFEWNWKKLFEIFGVDIR